MRDLAIAYLKELNKNGEVITRLYYNDGGNYVEDLSFYANSNYMSDSLLSAIQNGQSLTARQKNELERFIIVKRVDLRDIKEDSVRSFLDSKWLEVKEFIIEASNGNIIQNITFNIEHAPKDTDVAKFTESIIKTLKRQQGIR